MTSPGEGNLSFEQDIKSLVPFQGQGFHAGCL